ncbi:MAG: UvrD-helicase domain-containing protein [Bdellovibrionales bacterium]|nr:UvrD-helicase domain-containing protein [Bdellovibrionales bacterium]
MTAANAALKLSDNSYLDSLNPQQRQAVLHTGGPLLVFAGAGSGKTRVLTHRIAHLVLEHGVAPHRILAVTFTNKAAREMKERTAALFSHRGVPDWVATFHSIGVRILRIHARELDYQPGFAIYDAGDSLSLVKRICKKLKVDPKILEPRTIRSQIDRAKNDYIFPDGLVSWSNLPPQLGQIVAEVYERYQEELVAANAMDFGDLLCNVVTLFTLERSILEHYQEQFQHVLIDEYQDTNKVQYKLITQLAAAHQNLCVVGDDDQSIYAFRGASIDNILNFQKDFPDAKVVTLEQNYRSTKTILAAANAVIAKNERRQQKTLRTENEQGSNIVGHKSFDEIDEASFVSSEIARLLAAGVPASEIAIFYRTNAQSRAIEESLIETTIPYEIYGSHRFYERKEIKDILAYVRLLANEYDNEAFLRIINVPTRGIGAKSVANVVAYAAKEQLAYFPALKKAVLEKSAPFMKGAGGKKLAAFVTLMNELQARKDQTEDILAAPDSMDSYDEKVNALAGLINEIAKKSQYLERLRTQDTPEAESRVENIYELMTVASEFVRAAVNNGQNAKLSDFLDRVSLTSDSDEENIETHTDTKSTEPISLMTLHLAKGLEFDAVFVIGFEEGLLPHVRSIDDAAALEEERRLCYVGMTRARKHLYLTRARTRQTFGRQSFYGGVPSRFIEDLPSELIDDRETGFMEWYG